LRIEVPLEADVEFRVVLVQEVLELQVRELVPRLELTIVVTFLLHRVIREVDHPVPQVRQGELLAAGP